MIRRRVGPAGLLVALLVGCEGHRPPPDSLFELGNALNQRGLYDSARSVWTVALGRAVAAHDSGATARLLTERGLTNYRIGAPSAARADLEAAVTLDSILRLGDSALARGLNGLGLVAKDAGQYRNAIAYFERSAAAARTAGDQTTLARATGNMGLPQQELGDLGGARRSFQALRDAGRKLGDRLLEANGLANEASVDIWEGDPAPAIAKLDTASRLYGAIGYLAGRQNVFGQRATAFELTGEFGLAFAALDSSLDLARRQKLGEEQAEVTRLIGDLHGQTGDWRRAIRYFGLADSLYRATGVTSGRGAALRGAAAGYLALDNPRRARAEAEAALVLHAGAGELLDQLDDLVLLSDIERAGTGRWLDSADAVAARIGTRGARRIAALARARQAERRGNPRGVLAAVAPLRSDLRGLAAGWEVDALAAQAYGRLGALDSAVAAGRRAVATVERIRDHLGSDQLRGAFAAERAAVYGSLVLALLREGRTDESFAVADAARSRGLLDNLAAARREPGIDDLARGQELLRRIDRLVERLRATTPRRSGERAGPDPEDDLVVRELIAARSEYEAMMARADRSAPRAGSLLGRTPARLDDVRAVLASDEVLLEYLVTDDRLVLFAVQREGLRVLQLPADPRVLSRQVDLLRDLWGRPSADWRHGLPAADALGRGLIDPVRRAGIVGPGVKRLIIVPHGVLGQLPFAALHDATTGRFLVEDFAVSYLPSAAALPALRAVHRAPMDQFGGEVFAPFPSELPATLAEVAAFREAIPEGAAHLGRGATEAAFRAALGGGRVVHLASHGTLNARNPMFSRVELAPPNGSADRPSAEDGRLEVHELLGLAIRSPLLFFSGCETGAGRGWTEDPVRGTADHTLAQAALSAGAANVIATLWRIDDAGAAELARRFYRELRGRPVTEALAAAQRELATVARYASPYYWAGYTLSGEGSFGGGGSPAKNPAGLSVYPH